MHASLYSAMQSLMGVACMFMQWVAGSVPGHTQVTLTAAAAVSSLRAGCQVYTLMEQGSNARMVGATKVNEASSRSHAVFIVIVEKSTSGFPETRSSPGELSTSARGLWHANLLL